jgi:hypothetical protein
MLLVLPLHLISLIYDYLRLLLNIGEQNPKRKRREITLDVDADIEYLDPKAVQQHEQKNDKEEEAWAKIRDYQHNYQRNRRARLKETDNPQSLA